MPPCQPAPMSECWHVCLEEKNMCCVVQRCGVLENIQQGNSTVVYTRTPQQTRTPIEVAATATATPVSARPLSGK